MRDDLKTGCVWLFLVAAFFGFVLCISYIHASWEAAAYKRVTGKEVSAWDAMFLDLRIAEDVKDSQ